MSRLSPRRTKNTRPARASHFPAAPGDAGNKSSADGGRPEATATSDQRKKDIEAIRYFGLRLGTFALVMVVLFGFIFKVAPVPDMSMKPKLMAGDLTLVYRLDKRFSSGDVVAFEKDSKLRFGRIVAAPGDRIDIRDGSIFINDARVVETDIFYKTDPLEDKVSYPLTLGPDEYFILGDMREGARDSRFYGPIEKGEIIGKVSSVFRHSEI